MIKKLEKILNTPLFANISQEDALSLLSCLSAREATFKKDEYIITSGNKAKEVGIVLLGSVSVIKEDFWGNRAILAKFGEGHMFAEAFACAGIEQTPVSVVSNEKTEILFIDYKKIITTCSSSCIFHARIISNMMKILAGKNIMLMQKMEHIVKKTTREKLLSYLSEQAITCNNNSFAIPFNRQEMADFLSVDRSAMSNELSKLRDEGVLNFKKNEFELLNH